jgi:hypothetical protein
MERMNPTSDSSRVPHAQRPASFREDTGTAPEQGRGTQPGRDGAVTTLTNYLIVSGMLTCAAIGVVQLGLQLSPAWNAGYVPLLCFFVALESAYMTRYVHYSKLPVPWYVLRGIEAVVLFLLLRSLLGVLRGPQPEEVVNPFYGYVDGELFALVVITALTWVGSWRFASDLVDLETLDPALDREVIQEMAEAQVEVRRELITFTLIVGVALTFLAGLLRLYLRTNPQADTGLLVGLWHIVIYFFLALVLFSRTRLNLLRSGWVWDRVPIRRGVGARWISYTLLLLTIAVIVAVVLPTRYSLGLLDTLGYIFELLVTVIQSILFVIIGLFYALLRLLIPDMQQPENPLVAPPRSPQLPPQVEGGPPAISEFVQSLIFWGVFLIVAAYVATQYLRRHPEVVDWLKHLPGMGLLVRAWRKLREWFGGLTQQFEDLREARRRARRPAPVPSRQSAPRRWINPRRLSPRQQVRFYYLAMLRRGGERGHARQPTQTPYEYARTLESQIPEIDQDVDGLTEEFIEARYSPHDIPPEHVSLVRRYWERIKRALKR